MRKAFKVVLRILLILLIIVALICAGTGIYYVASKSCAVTVTVDPSVKEQTFYGWGTSSCWWADDIKDENTRSEVAKLLYGDEGLKMNIYRYNIGGGYDENNNDVTNKWRLNESFYYYDKDSKKYKYDFDRDKYAQAMLKECLNQNNIDTVVLFANSPHYSLCENGKASGNTEDSWKTNISVENYQKYVDYFLEITEYFIEKGVPVKYISPINEPQWGWGGNEPTQEGCHYEIDEMTSLLEMFSVGITEKHLNVQLCAPESGNIGDTTKNYYNTIYNDNIINENLGIFAYHSYFSDNDYTKKYKFGKWKDKNVSSKVRFDMTEWCELPTQYATTDVHSALVMARVIAQDIGGSKVNSWSSWVAMNETGVKDDSLDYSDGLLVANPNNTEEYYIAYRYYALKQFSSFIPSGSVMIDSKESVFTPVVTKDNDGIHISKRVNSVAFKTPENKIVVVVVNEGNSRKVNLKLDGYKSETVYTTDSKNKCVKTYTGEVKSKTKLGENSINTYIFEK